MRARLPVAALLGAIAIVLRATMAMAASQVVYALSQDDGTLSIIDTRSDEITEKIKMAGKPAAFAINAASHRAFATLPDSGEIAVIDLDRRAVLSMLKIGGQPFGIASDNAGRLFVGDWSANRISIVING